MWDGPTVAATVGLVDEGFIAPEVRAFCQRTQQAGEGCQFWPSKGRGGIQVRHTVQESMTEALGEPLLVYHYSDDHIKKMLYISRITRRVSPKPDLAPGPRLWMPAVVDPEFKAELCSEKLKIKREAGFSKEEWEKEATIPNDWGDALKETLVLWYPLQPLFRDWTPSFTLGNVVEGGEPVAGVA